MFEIDGFHSVLCNDRQYASFIRGDWNSLFL
jgi:hypothetical protein